MSSTASASTLPSGQALPAGTRLEEFVIERVLGSGGFGITYLAKDARLGRQVVIKENLPVQFCFRDPSTSTVRPRQTQGEDVENFKWSLENFEKEAAMLASLEHPGIVRVLRSFEANGTAYFVMPFIEGTALDEQIKGRVSRGNSFTEEELTGLLWRMLDALDYLHARGIYHRDIKPGNILITHEGIPILIDFGSARQRLSERSLTVMESAGYTPFEQLQTRGKIGPWSDLYALGATLYKAITGETPPKANDRAFDDPIVPLALRRALQGSYTERFLESIDHALEPRPEIRYQDAEKWRDAFGSGPETTESSGERATPEVTGDSPETRVIKKTRDLEEDSTVPVKTLTPPQSSSKKRLSAGGLTFPQKSVSFPITPVDSVSGAKLWTLGAVILGLLAIMILWAQLASEPRSAPAVITADSAKKTAPLIPAAAVPEVPLAQIVRPNLPDSPSAISPSDSEPVEAIAVRREMEGGVAGEVSNFGGIEMAWCPPGEFLMGSREGEEGRHSSETQRRVTLTRGFWLARTECTQRQWETIMGSNSSQFMGTELPVESVSWEDTQEWLKRMNERHPLPEGWKWELPTEAQWEYACRAGSTTPFSFGSVLNGKEANCEGNYPYGTNANGPYLEKTTRVGSYVANRWGLYDMHGNVWEWCRDWYAGYPLGAVTDTEGPTMGAYRVCRGGSWGDGALRCRSAFRVKYSPDYHASFIGFRPALIPSDQ